MSPRTQWIGRPCKLSGKVGGPEINHWADPSTTVAAAASATATTTAAAAASAVSRSGVAGAAVLAPWVLASVELGLLGRARSSRRLGWDVGLGGRLEGWPQVLVHQNAYRLEKVIPIRYLRANS